MAQFYVIEHDKRPDGIVNVSETARSTFALALSLYHSRYSTLCVSEQFTSASLLLVDEDLKVIEHATIATQYEQAEQTD